MSKGINQITLLILLITTLSFTDTYAQELNLQVRPNPAGANFKLVGLEGEARVIMYDMQGKVLLDKHIRDNEKIDLSNIKKGIYFLEISTKDGSMGAKLLKK